MVLSYEELVKFVDPGLIGSMIALFLLGEAIKRTKLIENAFIPYILITLGVTISILFFIGYHSQDQTLLQNIYCGIVQGIICAGAPIVVKNLIKQGDKIINYSNDN